MQCTNCGHERPRAGKCPHCGAPAPVSQNSGSHSSLRGWKDKAQSESPPGISQPPRDRPSRPNAADPRNSSFARNPNSSNTPSRPRAGGAEWGPPPSASYPRRPDSNSSSMNRPDPNASYPRRQDPAGSYTSRDNWDDDYNGDDAHALMVSPGGRGALMSPDDERALPALPSEDEERAMGIRRPAFIPATEERKGPRAGRWRVISGFASIMLLCTALVLVSSLLVKNNVFPRITSVLGIAKPSPITLPVAAVPTAYRGTAPLVTPVPNAPSIISNIQSSKTFTQTAAGQPTIDGVTPLFIVNDNVNISFKVVGAKPNDTFSSLWYLNGQDLTPSLLASKPDCCSQLIASDKEWYIHFWMKEISSVGLGKTVILYNGVPVATVLFDVIAPANTPTPVPPTATPGPAVTPTVKH